MIIHIDLDGVIADFNKARDEHPLGQVTPYKGRPDKLPDIYKDLEPITGAIESVTKLLEDERFEVFILSSAPWDNPNAWTHKRIWVEKHFGKAIRNRLILTKRKDLVIGDILVDDLPWNGAKEFQGTWIEFGSQAYPDWNTVLNYLESLR